MERSIFEDKSVHYLKQYLRELQVDHSACTQKTQLINLIHRKLKDDGKEIPTVKSSEATDEEEENIFDTFRKMGLEDYESHNINYCKKFLARNPKSANTWYNLGVNLYHQGRMSLAEKCYLKAIKFEPDFKLPHNNLGAYYKENMEMDKAVYHYQRALQSDPNFAIALNNLAITYHVMGKLAEAQEYCKRAIQVEPDNAAAHNNLGTLVLQAGCSADEAVQCFSKCIELDPHNSAGRYGAYSNRLLASNSTPAPCEDALTGDEEDVYNNNIWRYHKEWADQFEKRFLKERFTEWPNTLDLDRPIRVGYLSTDLRRHPVSYFAYTPLNYMDEKKVEVYVYLNGPPGDERTAQIRQKIPDARWRCLINYDKPMQICNLIRNDKIDILVELGGHASGNRQDIMVLKPAPIQVTWMGYANTTGLSCVDYRITDSIADPYNTHQQFSEKLVRMPDPCAFLCYAGTPESKECAGAPALKKGYITFGSFNALHKLTDQAFNVWVRILNEIEGSHLFLKCKPFASDAMRERYLTRFEKHGIKRDRIKMMTHVPSREDHLNLYKDIDVGLDPFPYAGTTTSAEALWMGVPFITLQRMKFPIHAQNVGVSFLSRIPSMKRFIARTKQEYVDIAVYWSTRLNELSKIKANLRKDMLNSPLCKGQQFCDKLTEVYQKMWDTYCKEKKLSNDS